MVEQRCENSRTIQIQKRFQTCSHSTATSVYQTIQDITSVQIISLKLCKALTTIGTACIKHLYECFAEDDVKQMRKSHLEEMKRFLQRIVQGKLPGSALDNCEAVMIEEDSVDTIVYSYDDDDDDYISIAADLEVSTDVSVDNIEHEITEIRTETYDERLKKIPAISEKSFESEYTTYSDLDITTSRTTDYIQISENSDNDIHDNTTDDTTHTSDIRNSDETVTDITERTRDTKPLNLGRTEIVNFPIDDSDVVGGDVVTSVGFITCNPMVTSAVVIITLGVRGGLL